MDYLRALVFTAVFYLWSGATAILCTPILLGPRSWTMFMLRYWSRGVIFLLRWVGGVKTEFRGLENIPKGAALIGAKHQCMYDTFAPWSVIPDAAYVLRKELLMIPWFGWYAQKAGCIVVDREGQAAALKALVREAKTRVADNRQVVIFPEGHRHAPGDPGDYKPGVAAIYAMADVACTPLATNSGVHWPKPGKARPTGTIVFEFLPVIPAGLKRAEFMQRLEESVETASNRYLAEGL